MCLFVRIDAPGRRLEVCVITRQMQEQALVEAFPHGQSQASNLSYPLFVANQGLEEIMGGSKVCNNEMSIANCNGIRSLGLIV